MANIYWINTAGGNWATVANWSLPSDGGARRVPTATDVAYFNAASGSGVSTLTSTITIGGLDCTGFSGTIAVTGAIQLTVRGNAVLSATAAYSGTGTFAVYAFGTSATLTTNNAAISNTLVKVFGTSVSDTVTIIGNLNCTNTFQANTCTLNINGSVITCAYFKSIGNATFAFGSSGTGAIVIPTGGILNATVVDFSTGGGYTSTYSGAQRPVIRLTYTGAVATRKVLDQTGIFDYVWSGADLNNPLTLSCRNLDLSNFTGSILMSTAMSISGSLTFNAATKWTSSSFALTFNGTSTQNIDTKGIALNCPVTFSGTGSYVLASTMSMGSLTSATTLTSGTLNLNGKTLTVGNFSSSNSNVRGITFASGKIIVGGTTAAWAATVGTNLTITGPGAIELTSATAATRIFAGGDVAYNGITLIISGAATGNNTAIRGSNSFYSMINTISPQTIWFDPNSVTIFTDDFQLNGTAGKNINITSQTAFSSLANAPKFAKPSGNVVCSYANIIWNTAGYTGSPATSTFTSTWTTGVGTVLTANQTSGWTKSAGSAGFLTLFYP